MLRLRSFVAAAVLLAGSAALAQDWPAVPVVKHSVYQAVHADGASAYSGGFPIRLIGVVLNDTEDWLNPAPAFSLPTGWPPPPPAQMGGEAEFYVQAVDLDPTAWDDDPLTAFDDFGGTACWVGQNYGNLWLQDGALSYSDAAWLAELGRLDFQGGAGVTDPIRAGDLVEIRARAGLHYQGKMNVNEQHSIDPANDFEIVRLAAGFGLPAPQELSLSDLKTAADAFVFDPTRATGPEHYQSTRVKLRGVWLDTPADWSANGDITVTDGVRTFQVHLGLDASFDGTELFGAGEPFDVVGILDQAASDGVFSTDGYRLLAMDAGDFVPEPAGMALLLLGSLAMARRRRRDC